MNEVLNEPFGFKVAVGGFATWVTSMVQGADLTQVLGFVALVLGVFIQIVSFYRNKKADQRDIEADERSKIKYNLEMKVLTKELAGIETRASNDNK